MKKIKLLYILNVANKVNNFSYTSMLAAQELGFEFHIAGNWSYESDEERMADEERYGIKIHQIDFVRAPYHPGNIKAYKQLKALARKEQYDVIHCNTPIGGVLGRIIGKQLNVQKVIYQAHGFHFYKGAPKVNWIIYYPIEKWLAKHTDALITINKEDFELAKSKFKLRGKGKVYYIHGVGIDTDFYIPDGETHKDLQKESELSDNDFAVISVGRLEQNKNTETLIKAVSALENRNIKLILCGDGEQREYLEKLSAELGLKNQVIFLGNVADMKKVYRAADVLAAASFREGLSRTVMEAMASGLPCVISKIRGNTDLIEDGKGGFLCEPTDFKAYSEAITVLSQDASLRESMKNENLNRIKEFNIPTVVSETKKIYGEVTGRV